MDHTPMTPAADDRPIRILDRAPVPQEHKDRLFHLVRLAQDAATAAGDVPQAEFGKEHVALIANHNQFLRLFRGGPLPGAVELWLEADDKAALASAGFQLLEPDGAVFRLFGWVRIDPTKGPLEPLEDAVRAAVAKAMRPKGKS